MNAKRGFTPGQEGKYRPMVKLAWKRHCELQGLPLTPANKDRNPAFAKWYADELKAATGKPSSEFCTRTRDFTHAIAHFEALAADGIFWQMKLYGDDARRIAWNIRELTRINEVEEDYMRGMARRMLRLGDDCPLPTLDQMTDDQLLIIMGELKRWLRRKLRKGDPF